MKEYSYYHPKGYPKRIKKPVMGTLAYMLMPAASRDLITIRAIYTIGSMLRSGVPIGLKYYTTK